MIPGVALSRRAVSAARAGFLASGPVARATDALRLGKATPFAKDALAPMSMTVEHSIQGLIARGRGLGQELGEL